MTPHPSIKGASNVLLSNPCSKAQQKKPAHIDETAEVILFSSYPIFVAYVLKIIHFHKDNPCLISHSYIVAQPSCLYILQPLCNMSGCCHWNNTFYFFRIKTALSLPLTFWPSQAYNILYSHCTICSYCNV